MINFSAQQIEVFDSDILSTRLSATICATHYTSRLRFVTNLQPGFVDAEKFIIGHFCKLIWPREIVLKRLLGQKLFIMYI